MFHLVFHFSFTVVLSQIVISLCDLRGTYQFPHIHKLDRAVGMAIQKMGPRFEYYIYVSCLSLWGNLTFRGCGQVVVIVYNYSFVAEWVMHCIGKLSSWMLCAKFGLWKGVFEVLGASLQTPKRYLAVSLQCSNDFNISHPCKKKPITMKKREAIRREKTIRLKLSFPTFLCKSVRIPCCFSFPLTNIYWNRRRGSE